jgi:hypothetical protein
VLTTSSIATACQLLQEESMSSRLPQDTPTTTTSSAPRRQRLFVAEITCLLCARPVGTARAESWPPGAQVAFQPAGSTVVRQCPNVWRLRCPICGGTTGVDELVEITLRFEDPTVWLTDRPRQGQPPKSLVQQRREANQRRADESDGPTRLVAPTQGGMSSMTENPPRQVGPSPEFDCPADCPGEDDGEHYQDRLHP